jgi:LysM repeat protein
LDPRLRRELTRYGAPAAFLAAVTIAVLLVKAGLNADEGATTTRSVPRKPVATTTTRTTTRLVLTTTTPTSTTAASYYEVRSGDTLGSIAARNGTTVDELLALNPGIDPAALRVGQRIRVG